eukprot:TRINITY_DN2186_c0_g3_i1.p1 TRINITY_DN2186_c0_g3~~TRINITY_DN2186_c0_g3_i1.p1  ORF type:complete len:778 (-),score=172.12 TRINITY_DN2186_c0_g3_i1:517-2850(-)
MASVMKNNRTRLSLPTSLGNHSNLPSLQESSDPAPSLASISNGQSIELPEFTREYVEALLNEKMKGKTKFDYKGKCEQMTEYIKKLRLCIRSFQEQTESHVTAKELLEKELASERKLRTEAEDTMKQKEEKLNAEVLELKNNCSTLQERLSNADADMQECSQELQKEREARKSVERAEAQLTEERNKAQQEASSANEQVASLQDINRRLQEYNTSLQQYNSKLQMDATANAETIAFLQKEKSAMMEELSSLKGRFTVLQDQFEVAKTSLQETLQKAKELAEENERLRSDLQHTTDENNRLASEVQILSADVLKYKECTGKSAIELEQLTKRANFLEESFSSQSEQIKLLKQQLENSNMKLEIAESSALELKIRLEENCKKVDELQSRLVEAEHQVVEGELLRRKMHNTILELKGNVRVFCRVRPLLAEDGYSEDKLVVQYPTSMELRGRGIELLQGPGQKQSFAFDRVFSHEASQEEVFVDISELVQSALDGYKVCIFAYGQTGSGKTYTMMGKPDLPEHKGLIPRSLEQIFKTSEALSSQGWAFRMQASMLEIYNETIRDLLVANKPSTENNTPGKQYAIKHDQNGNIYVSDLTIVDVTNWSEVSSLLHKAALSRAVGRTVMNEHSSRSHCVFTLRIHGTNESTGQQVQGVLNLIDLAGSERLSRSYATGDRLRETQAINKSLASLGDVILAIANKDSHVPFRNSKLTYLLQPCLGGDSKTLMFVNVSPDPQSLSESLCSLRFAAKVNTCEIGIPRRQAHLRHSDARMFSVNMNQV